MDITPVSNKFTGSIYRWSSTQVNNGDSIVSVNGTKWVETDGTNEAPNTFDTESDCQADIDANGLEQYGVYCHQKTVTDEGIGDYTTDASTLNKTYYLKHDVVDDIITASYICFVTDTEHCMQGGNSSYYAANKTLLQSQESWFTGHSGSCSFGDNNSRCNSSALIVSTNSYGDAAAGVSYSDSCGVNRSGVSCCGVSSSGDEPVNPGDGDLHES